MYKPETEDMLPREAPKPSDSAQAFFEAKPTVPEVSLVFGQDDSSSVASKTSSEDSKNKEPQVKTYAEWKKQVLPKVTYPLKVTFASDKIQEANDYGGTRNTVYPLRNPVPAQSTYPISSIPNYPTYQVAVPASYPSTNAVYPCNAHLVSNVPNDLQFQRVFEENSSQPHPYGNTNQEIFLCPRNMSDNHQQYQTLKRKSLEPSEKPNMSPKEPEPLTYATPSQSRSKDDVLCICAGTQTDLSGPTFGQMDNFATKQDFNRLMNIIEEIKNGQNRLLHCCETLVQKNGTIQVSVVKETGTQCEILASNNSNIRRPGNVNKNCILEEDKQESPLRVEPMLKQGIFHGPLSNNHLNRVADLPTVPSPRSSKPIAQSTTYRPNTPPAKKPETNLHTVLPKPMTEKSMVMNELALKYLPNEKLNELLKELDISSPTQKQQLLNAEGVLSTPLKELDNFIKSSNDMSNASYRYLKKYRLLPEETSEKSDNLTPVYGQPNSPYQRKIVQLSTPKNDSPRISPAPDENNIDLAHIKNQPKFF